MEGTYSHKVVTNTFYLYMRMFLMMVISLYTTRVVLRTLGVIDFGIYNAIASVVVLFSFVNQAMVTTTQRFLNYYLEKDNPVYVAQIFSHCLIVHFCIGIIIFFLTELVGLWFLNTKMDFPQERYNSAFWTLQFSIAIIFTNIIRSPYNACIIAYEKMGVYAYISILEAVMKLLVAYILSIATCDKLILYCVLLFVTSIFVMFIYKCYCNKQYSISRFRICWDASLFKKIFSFSGYSLIGNAANVISAQGVNMMLNSFLGVVINAAVGLAHQISAGVHSLAGNFQTAFNPVMVKTYAKGDYVEVNNMIIRYSKISAYLLVVIVVPLILFCDEWLTLWLTDVPEYTTMICLFYLIDVVLTSVSAPLWITVQASGNIRKYQIIVSGLILLVLPLTFISLKMQITLAIVFGIKVMVDFIVYVFRLLYVRELTRLSIRRYLRYFFCPVLLVSSVVLLFGYVLSLIGINYALATIALLVVSVAVVYYLGIEDDERFFLKEIFINKLHNGSR